MKLPTALLLGGPNDGTVLRFGPLGNEIRMTKISEDIVGIIEEADARPMSQTVSRYLKASAPVKSQYEVYFYQGTL